MKKGSGEDIPFSSFFFILGDFFHHHLATKVQLQATTTAERRKNLLNSDYPFISYPFFAVDLVLLSVRHPRGVALTPRGVANSDSSFGPRSCQGTIKYTRQSNPLLDFNDLHSQGVSRSMTAVSAPGRLTAPGVPPAPGPASTSSPDQSLTCSLCGQILRDARVLPVCFHSFCFSCLEKYAEHRKEFPCPHCKTVMHKGAERRAH